MRAQFGLRIWAARSTVVLATAAITAGLASTVALAQETYSAPPTVTSASVLGDDVTRIRVAAQADAGVSTLVAHILTQDTLEEVAVLDSFELVAGTTAAGEWVSTTPLPGLELGRHYWIDVNATDALGQQTEQLSAGLLHYAIVTKLSDVAYDRAVVDYSDPRIKVSGRLWQKQPGASYVALADVPVAVTTPSGYIRFTTDERGHFRGSVPVEQPISLQTHFNGEGLANAHHYQQSSSDLFDFTITALPVRVSASASPATVQAGQSVTVTGRAQYSKNGDWRAAGSQRLPVSFCGESGCEISSTSLVTDSHGRFTHTFTPSASGEFRVDFPTSPFFEPGGFATTAITVA